MLKQTVVYPHQGILLSNTKEQTSDKAIVWVDLKGIMLSGKANLIKITYCIILCM